MRFLKKKVNLKPEFLNEEVENFDDASDVNSEHSTAKTDASDETCTSAKTQEILLPIRKPRQKPINPLANSKNIVKNYGKALCSFACSNIAVPYIENIIFKNGWNSIQINNFIQFLKLKKEGISNIESLRKLLVENEKDSQEELLYKKIFKSLSITFLKYFAVNWIFGGRLQHKKSHLDFRFRMLRRIQNPENFTYLKTIVK